MHPSDADRDGLLLQARYADLVVVSQDLSRDHGRRATTERGLPQYLALHGARPVLVVPDTYHGKPIPGDALVGWDGSMPAQRAINAALPLLAQAGTVHLALVNPDLQSGLHGDEPGADMAHYLARHGLPATLADLDQHQCIGLHAVARWPFVVDGSLQRRRAEARVLTSSVDAARAAALQGLGITMLAYWDVHEQLRAGALVRIELQDAGMEQLAVWAVTPTRRYVPERVKVFLEALEAELTRQAR